LIIVFHFSLFLYLSFVIAGTTEQAMTNDKYKNNEK
jgi:hypothetical protein